jgi:organic radical activating enzyme
MHLMIARNDDGGPEIFRSIQGEGPNCGRIRTFIRLSGCNLHCIWCDTAYTWNWIGTEFAHERDAEGAPHKFDPQKEALKLSVDEACARAWALPSEGVVITGGEPLMQKGALLALIDRLRAAAPAMRVEIETNGSIAPPSALVERVDLFVVSPKLKHSGNARDIAIRRDALRSFTDLDSAVFKIVARTPEDIEEAAELASELGIASGRVFIMAEGTDSETLAARSRTLAGAVIERGFGFSPRLHIELFGSARGT